MPVLSRIKVHLICCVLIDAGGWRSLRFDTFDATSLSLSLRSGIHMLIQLQRQSTCLLGGLFELELLSPARCQSRGQCIDCRHIKLSDHKSLWCFTLKWFLHCEAASFVIVAVLLYLRQVYHEEALGLTACGLAYRSVNESLVKGWCSTSSGRLQRQRTPSSRYICKCRQWRRECSAPWVFHCASASGFLCALHPELLELVCFLQEYVKDYWAVGYTGTFYSTYESHVICPRGRKVTLML